MKKMVFVFALALLIISSAPALAKESAAKKFAFESWSEEEVLSYILGTQIGKLGVDNDLKIDIKFLKKGMSDLEKGKKLAIPESGIKSFMGDFQRKAQERRTAAAKNDAEANMKEGKEIFSKPTRIKTG